MWADIAGGLLSALDPMCLVANAVGVALGIIFGALPGLTATMGVALLMPLTFNMPSVEAFSALLGMYCGAIYGGSITAILVGTPGTVAAAATMLEGPSFTARGESKKALDMATIASFIGGITSCIILIALAPVLARAATAFGAEEYFAVAIFGMAVVASLAASAVLKGSIAALLGFFLATVGGDPLTGELRNTFDISHLYSGLPLVPVLVGLFAVSQVFITIENYLIEGTLKAGGEISNKGVTFRELWANRLNFLRSSIIGTIVGIIPATGSGTASYLAYSEARRNSRKPEEYGHGSLEGIAATESANNAVTGGALIPLLTLGVPGDIVTAIMLGALMIQGLVPGPLLFMENAPVVYGIFAALVLSNVLMLTMGLLSIRPLSKVLLVPTGVLMPVVISLCVVGGYAVNNSTLDLVIVVIFGIVGYIMHKIDMPQPPLLLAMILAPIAETNFRRAMLISNDDLSVFLDKPIALGILLLALLVVIKTVRDEVRKHRR